MLERCVDDLDEYVDAVARGEAARPAGQARARGRLRPGHRRSELDRAARRRTRGTTCSARCTSSTASPVDQEPGLERRAAGRRGLAPLLRRLADAAAAASFDVLAHPDLSKIFGVRPEPTSAGHYLHVETADAIEAAGVCVEVSTAGLHKPVGELYPDRGAPRGLPSSAACRSRSPRTRTARRTSAATSTGPSRSRARPATRRSPSSTGASAGRSRLAMSYASASASTRTRSPTACRSCSAASRSTHPRGLAGHSDGDVIAHALIDAVLGAAGLGDIGSLFPSDDEPTGRASTRSTCSRAPTRQVRDAGFELVERRLRPHRRGAADRAACARRCRRGSPAALGVEPGAVTVRATTTDGLGFTGRGEGLAAQAVALLSRQADAAPPSTRDQPVARERLPRPRRRARPPAAAPRRRAAASARAAGGTSPRTAPCLRERLEAAARATGTRRRAGTRRSAARARGRRSRRGPSAPARTRGRTRTPVRSSTRRTFTSTGSTGRPSAKHATASAV